MIESKFFENLLFATAPLVAITHPFGDIPVFLSIVEKKSTKEKLWAAGKVGLGVLIVLFISSLTGQKVLDIFGVSLPAFQAAGGLVITMIGVKMLSGGKSHPISKNPNSSAEDDELWVPLVMPLLAGPGAITTVVALSIREEKSAFPAATLSACVIASLIIWLGLSFSGIASRFLSPRIMRIMNRFFGLILIAIGFQMGMTGVKHFFGI